MEIGISKDYRENVAHGLSNMLTDAYVLYIKSHSYHWNVTGPNFSSLHLLFETQCNELHDAADTITERIRALDIYAPGSYGALARLASLGEDNDAVPAPMAMLCNLVSGHEALGVDLARRLQDRRSGWRSGNDGYLDRAHGSQRQSGLDGAQSYRMRRVTLGGTC